MIKVLWISNYSVEVGRGPVFRLMNMMSSMSKLTVLSLFSLGPYDDCIRSHANAYGIRCYESDCIMDGWHVVNSDDISNKVLSVCQNNEIDLVVLTWEIWDLAVSLYNKLKGSKIKFITVIHSIPFAGMPVRRTTYGFDVLKRILSENQWEVKAYLIKNSLSSIGYLKKIPLLTMTPTVEKRLKSYFKQINLYCAYPGYAVDYKSQIVNSNINYKYDLAFMARFEKGKGIYDLVRIVNHIKVIKPDIRIVMIGTFTFQEEEARYKEVLNSEGLNMNFDFVGWQTGDRKIECLRVAKLFVYPSISGDTFSIAMLEALSVGKKVVCYDVPFIRDNYSGLEDVYTVKVHDTKSFAEVCCNLLNLNSYSSNENILFVEQNYSNWESVSESEYLCYLKYLADCEVK